ncbi:MAG: hypothetical protein PHS82_09730 [Lachnospiraceae bacterium]|nr:hypothetical protein [Lachnospiraceae bacterium]
MNKKIILLSVSIPILLIFVGMVLYRNKDICCIDTPWECGYAGPRQYYWNGDVLYKDTQETINGISYEFDSLGYVIQQDNVGFWSDESTKKMYTVSTEPGAKEDAGQLKNMWYIIDGETYYFDKNGYMVADQVLKEDGYLFYVNAEGKLQTGEFEHAGHRYFADDNGIILSHGEAVGDKKTNENGWLLEGHVYEAEGWQPWFIYNGTMYNRYKGAHYWADSYELLYTLPNVEEDGVIQGERYYLLRPGDKVYQSKTDESLFVLEKQSQSFYEYVS